MSRKPAGRYAMWMVKTVLACTVLLICTAAWATVYEWVDSQGVVHLTDDADKVPARYRKVMKVREIGAGENILPASEPNATTPSSGASLQEGREVLLYGGHDMKWWMDSFKEARENLKKLNDKIADNKKNLEELHRKRVLYQKPSDRVAYYALMDSIAKDEEQVKVLEKNLLDLQSSADAAGVPQNRR
jgi:Domain of unknown function (DUF4124)